MFLLASVFGWLCLLFAEILDRLSQKMSKSVVLIASSQVCGVLSGLMILMLDTKLKRVNDNELFWLKSSFCLAVLGCSAGELGVQALFEAIASRKQLVQLVNKRSLATCIGCAAGSAWAVMCIVSLKSTFLAALPSLIIAGFFLFIVVVFLRIQLQPHRAHSIKLQETLLKETIEIEEQQRKGQNFDRTYF